MIPGTGSVITQSMGDASIKIDLEAGCRLASLEVGGRQLLVTSAPSPVDWGCYPMAPYAGRVRDGRFSFRGRSYELPRPFGEHAIHGSVFLRRWEAESDSVFVTELGREWPFPGRVRQEIRLGADQVNLRLEVHSTKGAMPASCGWHPWFRRNVGAAEAEIDIQAGFMYQRDDAGIATRRRRPVTSGPLDDCLGEVRGNPTITWPNLLRLELESSCDVWVVYTELEHARCVEPQSAPPDALNHDPFLVEPGRPLVAEFTMRWLRTGVPAP
ncbi:MAG: aldose 1-epimerase [Acidimicrobiia bacterium]|nr:aldose 1-epimerase [Acidimicrobiia bacterium]